MPTSRKRTHSLWRNIGWMMLIVAALLIPTLKWGGLLHASETNAATTPWKAANKPRTTLIGRGVQHKIQVSDPVAASELQSHGARLLADYGSYKLFETDLETAWSMHNANRGELRDESNLILLNAGVIDTTSTAVQALRRNLSAKPGTKTTGMRLVQFVGSVKPEWHEALSRTGVRIVTYIPNNAYLVYGDGSALANLREWAQGSDFVQWDGDYTAEHRVDAAFNDANAKLRKIQEAKGLNAKANLAQTAEFDHVIVQLVSDTSTNQNTINSIKLQLGAQAIVRNTIEYGYVNIVAKLPAGVSPDVAAKNLGARPDVVSIQPYKIPVKMDERQDMIMAANLAGNVPNTGDWLAYLAANGFTQAQFTASNFAVNVSDSGIDNATTNPNHFGLHLSGDLTMISRVIYNRLLGTPNSGSTLQGCDGHGNLNSHIVAGFVPTGNVGGVNYGAFPHADASGFRYGMGVAPFVKVGSSVIFDPDTFTDPDYEDLESQAYNNGSRISTNSWGSNSAGAYNSDSQRYDALVRDAQPAGSTFSVAGNQENVIVFAAGNQGSAVGSVGSPGTGKNVITVGASENVQAFGGADQCTWPDSGADNANDMASFSGRGPCDDGRIKPDIVAPGTHVSGGVFQASAVQTGNGVAGACFDASGVCGGPAGSPNFFPAGQQFYTASTGTSHSTPATSGAAALIRQRFINGGLTPPSPAMTKATLMNSARYLNGAGANDNLFSNSQGMGEVNLTQFFDTQLGTVGTTHSIVRDEIGGDMFTASGQTRVFTGIVNNNAKPFRVVLAWTDPPGPTSGNAFVNNLDLEVTVGGNTYLGNVFTGANSATGGTADTRNNTESVFIPAGVSGNFVVTVKGTNIAGDGVPNVGGALDQDFALIVYNADAALAPVIASAGATLVSESCTPANGVLDPNEFVTVSFCLQNVGTSNTTALTGTLQASGGVTSPSSPQNYGIVVAGGPAVCRNFTFVVNPALSCGAAVTATIQLQDGASNLGTLTYNFQTGVLTTILTENFDGVSAPALPAGWTTSFTNGDADCTVGGPLCALGTNWVTDTTTPDTAPNSAFHNDPSCVTDSLLVSPVFAVTTSSAQLTFRNNFNTESTFDGGVLEIKIGAGAFTDIVTAGGSFVSGGYTGTISVNFLSPIAGRQAWTGNSSGFLSTVANLPAAAAGQNVQLRWRMASDCSLSVTGWRVDTVKVTDGFTCSTSCGAPTCTITCPANITVPNTTNQCSAVVTYSAPTTSGTCGTVTCTPASGATFAVGTTTVSCSSSVGGGSCSFTVTVQDTQAPAIGACPANITANGSGPTVVTYTPPTATDNCPGVTVVCAPASGTSFPLGTTTVTCTASDASPNSPDTNCMFTVTVTPCTITCPANITAWTSTTSAPVTYPAPTTTGSCGTVTCTPASGSTFNVGTTTVTCSTTAGPSCSFTVTVNRLALGATLDDPLACAGPGDKLNGSFSATNTTGASASVSVSATLSNIAYLPGTATASQPGAIVVLSNVISWTGTLGAGQTVTVSYMGQIIDTLTPGGQACSVTTATVNGLPVFGSASACVTVNCPAPGPGGIFPATSEASDQKMGSVLVYNIYTSGATSGNTQNTRINITNAHPLRPSFVHLFFVAEGCSIADSYICLTGNQTASFLASDLDPGTTGYLVAVAVNVIGCPTSHNYLIGDEYVKFSSGHAANLGAISFAQIAGGLPACDGNSVTATLNFDGVSYNRVPAVLALDSVGSRADGNDTLLIVNRIGGNLGIGASTLGTLFGILYDDAESSLSFSLSGNCQLRNSLSNNFPRTTPRFETFIPAGRTGWLKIFNQTAAIGITGSAINFNPNAASSAGAFNQGHNLHHLTLTTSSYVLPIFPPSC